MQRAPLYGQSLNSVCCARCSSARSDSEQNRSSAVKPQRQRRCQRQPSWSSSESAESFWPTRIRWATDFSQSVTIPFGLRSYAGPKIASSIRIFWRNFKPTSERQRRVGETLAHASFWVRRPTGDPEPDQQFRTQPLSVHSPVPPASLSVSACWAPE